MPSICRKTNSLKQCVPVSIPKATITPHPAIVSAYMNPLKGGLTKVHQGKKQDQSAAPQSEIKDGKPPPLPAERLIKRLFDKSINHKEQSSNRRAKVIEETILETLMDCLKKT